METQRYKWILLTESYLALSKMGLAKIEASKRHRDIIAFYAVIFNVKHSIELGLKSLTVTSVEEYEKNHDLKKLAQHFEEKNRIKSIHRTNLLNLAEKYYKLDFCGGKFRKNNFNDTKNEAFRFPSSFKGKYILDLQKVNSLEKKDILEIKEDIRYLESAVRKLYLLTRRKKLGTFHPNQKARYLSNLLSPKISKRKLRYKIESRNQMGQPLS